METWESHVSVLLEVAISVITDAIARCTALESAQRDLVTLKSRVKHEGISFLTITLPTLGQDTERCLDLGYVDSQYFRSFRKYRRIPAFLQGIFSQVFDADTGKLKNEPSIEAIKAIRQIAYCFKKLKLPCTPERVRATFNGYINDELDLSLPLKEELVHEFGLVSSCLWSWMYSDPSLVSLNTLPKHGPGATAERISGNQKYVFRSWHNRLEPYFPLDSFAFASLSALESTEFKDLTIVDEADELPVRVITVPKTLKSPRIIAIEPVCMQYAQQALSQVLVRALEKARVSSGHINFSDQSINRSLALISSKTCEYATLDMSSASDRVPAALVDLMLASNPDFRDAVFACRSKSAQLPDGRVISLLKFASMGSALCFPIESMYFYTCCVAILLKLRKLPVTFENTFKVSRDVYVYGDDIVIPANEAESVINHLQEYCCKVNMRKSFWTGKFRESCGMDAYNGMAVTPTYLRSMPPDNRHSASELVSWVETARLFEKDGWFSTSEVLYKHVESILGKLPRVQDTSAGLGRVASGKAISIERWNQKTQVPEVRTFVPKAVHENDPLSGYPALLKFFLNAERRSPNQWPLIGEKDHLKTSARHGAVALQRRWTRPY